MHLAVMPLSSPLLWESVSLPLSCMSLAFSRNAAIYSVDVPHFGVTCCFLVTGLRPCIWVLFCLLIRSCHSYMTEICTDAVGCGRLARVLSAKFLFRKVN